MSRKAKIIGSCKDFFGDGWDIRESRPVAGEDFCVFLGWPVGIPRGKGGSGGPQVILTAELVAYLEKHRMYRTEMRLPINNATITRLRRILGHAWKADNQEWWEERAVDLLTLNAPAFAKKHDTKPHTASIWYNRLFGMKLRPARWWLQSPAKEHLLSEFPRTWIAQKLEISIGSVGRLRWMVQQHGEEAEAANRGRWTEEEIALLGTDVDRAVAAKVGRTLAAVHAERNRRKIPSYAIQVRELKNPGRVGAKKKDASWTEEEDAMLGTAVDSLVAKWLGISRVSVTLRRQRLQIQPFRRHRGKKLYLEGKSTVESKTTQSEQINQITKELREIILDKMQSLNLPKPSLTRMDIICAALENYKQHLTKK